MSAETTLPDYSLPEEQVPMFFPEVLAESDVAALKEEIAGLLKARNAVLVSH